MLNNKKHIEKGPFLEHCYEFEAHRLTALYGTKVVFQYGLLTLSSSTCIVGHAGHL